MGEHVKIGIIAATMLLGAAAAHAGVVARHVVVALASMAYGLQKSVHVQGAGTCAAGTSVEALFDIYTLDDVPYSVSPGLHP
jgi:hypothetical protein